MDSSSDQPLTVEEAKNRLRRSSEATLPSGYVKRHPYRMLLFAFAAGYLLARAPHRHQDLVARTVMKAL